MSFVHPNVVIIKKISDRSPGAQTRNSPSSLPRFGLREDEIDHSQGLITKDEVRAVSIHALRLPDTGVLWDVGAGSGAIAIEAARLCPRMDVFAVEKNEDRIREIERNKTTFTAANLTVVRGEAPYQRDHDDDRQRIVQQDPAEEVSH